MNRRKYLVEAWDGFELVGRRNIAALSVLLAKYGLSHSQWLIFMIVGQRDGVTVKEIAVALGITSSAVTQLLDGLEKHGFVRRQASATDRRALAISPTPKFRRLFKKMKDQHLAFAVHLLASLTDSEFRAYVRLMRKIVENIEVSAAHATSSARPENTLK